MPCDPLSRNATLPKAQGRDWGASERFAVSPGNEANAYLRMPTGQSGHPLSEFYRAGHEFWVQDRTCRKHHGSCLTIVACPMHAYGKYRLVPD